MTRRDKDGVRWELHEDFAPLLERVLSSPNRVIKESPAKLVTANDLADKVYFVKRYRSDAVPLRSLKFFFKASQARKEWELARQLDVLRIPIVRHVALGERWCWRGLVESILITEAFAGTPLDEAPSVDPQAALRFVEQMHAHGVLQRDLHPGNLLVSPESGEIRLVDLHGAKIASRLTEQERTLNLASLRIALPIPVSPAVQQVSVRERRRRLCYRSKRCLKHNREFAPRRLGRLRWRVRLPFLTDAVRRILEDPDECLSVRAEILKTSRTSTVGRLDGVVVKRFNLRKLENLLKDCFRPSRAYRAFRRSYHLELAGIPTARPIAAAERRMLGVLRRSYVVMEEIPAAVTLGDYLQRGEPPSRANVRHLAELLGRVHNEGFSHRDLKESNLMLDPAGDVYLLDLDGLKFLDQVPGPRAAADLARLLKDMAKHPAVTRVERFVFLRRYCQVRQLRRVPRLE